MYEISKLDLMFLRPATSAIESPGPPQAEATTSSAVGDPKRTMGDGDHGNNDEVLDRSFQASGVKHGKLETPIISHNLPFLKGGLFI